jgi:hypothetical protein
MAKSYLSMEKELEIQMNNITPNNLSLGQVIPTIKQMYLNGANDMDSKWRNAIETYAKRHNIKFAPGMINEIFNILNSNTSFVLKSSIKNSKNG